MKFFVLLVLTLLPLTLNAQSSSQIRVCTYNVLHVGDNDQDRLSAFRTVFHAIQPDILLCQEVDNEVGVVLLLDSALNSPNMPSYTAVPFHNGPDSDNALFFNEERVEFISARYYATTLRDVAQYTLRASGSSDTTAVFSVHFKASNDSAAAARRFEEAKVVREIIESLPEHWHVILAGDFNVYSASEQAYQWLIGRGDNSAILYDPINQSGDWNNKQSVLLLFTPRAPELVSSRVERTEAWTLALIFCCFPAR